MKTFRALALLVVGSFLGLAFGGCDDPSIGDPLVKSRDDVWDATIEVLQNQKGFHGFDEMDKPAGELVTRWRFRPSIHSHDGSRHRDKVHIEPAEPPIDPKTGKEQWVVKIEVEWERNEEIYNPTVYTEASWRAMGRDTEEEKLILDSIYFTVRDPSEFGPSEESRRMWEKKDQYEKDIAEQKKLEEDAAQTLRELEKKDEEFRARQAREKGEPEGTAEK